MYLHVGRNFFLMAHLVKIDCLHQTITQKHMFCWVHGRYVYHQPCNLSGSSGNIFTAD